MSFRRSHTQSRAIRAMTVTALLLLLSAPHAVRADALDDFNAHVEAANAANTIQDWPRVVAEATAALALADSASVPQSVITSVYSCRGAAEIQTQDWTAAQADLATALRDKTDDYTLWLNAGIADFYVGRYPEAVSKYTRALALSPPPDDRLSLTYNRGHAYQKDHHWREAIADFTAYLDGKGPNPDTARLYRAQSGFAMADKKDKAAPELNSALEDANFLMAQKDISVGVLYLRGDIFVALGEDAKAVADFTTAVDNAPTTVDKAEAYKKRVDFYLSRKDYPHAIADDTAAIAIAPTDELYDHRAALYYNTGAYADAVADYRQSQKLYPSPFTLGNLLNALQSAGDYSGALALCDEQIALDPKPEANLWYARRGRVRFHQRDWAGAADDYTAEIQNEQYMSQSVPNTRWAEAYAYRARAMAHKGDLPAAESDIAAAVKIVSDDTSVLFASADVARLDKDYPTALTDLDQILTKNDKDSDALYLRAQVELAQGDMVKAKTDDAAARALDSTLPALAFPTPPVVKAVAKTAVKTPVKPAPAERKMKP